MQWLNEPAQWRAEGSTIWVTAEAKTDFWRVTHSGHISDNGHFYYDTVSGDFVASVGFVGDYHALYDQAGLMVRADAEHWMKCGVELVDGVAHVSTVITREFSDWSLRPLAVAATGLWLRVKRQGDTLEVAFAREGKTFVMMRQGYFPPAPALDVGVMCCAPTGDGFAVTFEDFAVNPL